MLGLQINDPDADEMREDIAAIYRMRDEAHVGILARSCARRLPRSH
jgi:hypothetical protein